MLILQKLANQELITQYYINSIFEKIEKSKATMGKQINDIKQIYSISNEHEKQLKTILLKRNYLAHKFFKVNSIKVFTKEGKLEMIKECADFIDQGKTLDNELNFYYERHKLKLGITEEIISDALEAVKKEEIEKVKQRQNDLF